MLHDPPNPGRGDNFDGNTMKKLEITYRRDLAPPKGRSSSIGIRHGKMLAPGNNDAGHAAEQTYIYWKQKPR